MTDNNNNDFDAMFANNDDVFSGLDDPELQTYNRLPFFNSGFNYLLEIDTIKFSVSSQNTNRYYHIEFTILESSDPELFVGQQARHTITISGQPKFKAYGPAAFKGFLSAVTGIPEKRADLPDGFWGAVATAAIKEGKLNGEKVRLQTVRNNNNENFPFHNYSHYSGE